MAHHPQSARHRNRPGRRQRQPDRLDEDARFRRRLDRKRKQLALSKSDVPFDEWLFA